MVHVGREVMEMEVQVIGNYQDYRTGDVYLKGDTITIDEKTFSPQLHQALEAVKVKKATTANGRKPKKKTKPADEVV